MSSSISSAATLTTQAGTGVQTAAQAASGAGPSGASAMSSLTSNYQNFLHLLMTQLKNQDPTSPMDTNQFTTELVQFSSVEQQIKTNSSLTSLIQMTQAGEIIQSSSMVGHQVVVSSGQLSLQNGSAAIQFLAPGSGTAAVAVYDAKGSKLGDSVVNTTSGTNTWTWNGKDGSGKQLPDGAYTVAVSSVNSAGKTVSVPFDVVATATGVEKSGAALKLGMGGLSVDFSAVKSVVN